MRVLVTGSNGFIAKNLLVHLAEMPFVDVVTFSKENKLEELSSLLDRVDWVFHLAGINRPKYDGEFLEGNTVLTEYLCKAIKSTGRRISIVYSSSIQAELDNDYGKSKRACEELLLDLERENGNPVFIYRLPNVFGKWARPNYNSAVATFCHNIANNLPITINDRSANVSLVYIDDVIDSFLSLLEENNILKSFVEVTPIFDICVGELADQIYAFKASRDNLITESVGVGLIRALYSTYVSYLEPADFSYPVKQHEDHRGVFVEMLKTIDSGQFSFFTAHPGITRGGHYHHSKTEKFLVIKGNACFRFRHVVSGKYFERYTSGDLSEIVETVPGWTHDVTNVGNEELICMLWANEIFDREKPDTFSMPIELKH